MSPKTKIRSSRSHKLADLKAKAVAPGKASRIRRGKARSNIGAIHNKTADGIILNFRS
jgi:hypothetical protein